jgi:rare lipoprotein A
VTRSQSRRLAPVIALALFLVACGHKQAHVSPPPPPPIAAPQPTGSEVSVEKTPPKPQPKETLDEDVISVPSNARPLYVESGMASWYGAPYHNRRGSNGKVYNMNAMTAAHRTLPLGSIVRITNAKTGHSALVRITDRGPFIEGRIVDLSLAAAKAVDVWLPGITRVKLEVLETPAPLDSGGRWAVQIGAFEEEKAATELAEHLTRRYHTAKILRFSSPVGDWWVRVRVLDDDRERAEEVARDTRTTEGAIFLVRLD